MDVAARVFQFASSLVSTSLASATCIFQALLLHANPRLLVALIIPPPSLPRQQVRSTSVFATAHLFRNGFSSS